MAGKVEARTGRGSVVTLASSLALSCSGDGSDPSGSPPKQLTRAHWPRRRSVHERPPACRRRVLTHCSWLSSRASARREGGRQFQAVAGGPEREFGRHRPRSRRPGRPRVACRSPGPKRGPGQALIRTRALVSAETAPAESHRAQEVGGGGAGTDGVRGCADGAGGAQAGVAAGDEAAAVAGPDPAAGGLSRPPPPPRTPGEGPLQAPRPAPRREPGPTPVRYGPLASAGSSPPPPPAPSPRMRSLRAWWG
jgi:hypothetical protein